MKPNNPPKSDIRHAWHGIAWLIVLSVGMVAYLISFFLQPSVLGFVDADGSRVPRIVDLAQVLLVEQLFDGMSGNGRFSVAVLDRLPVLLAASGWLVLAGWIGLPLVNLALSSLVSKRFQWLLAAVCGLSLLSTATLLIGLAGGLGSRWPLLAVIVGLAFASWLWQRWQSNQPEETSSTANPPAGTGAVSQPAIQPDNLISVWLLRLVPLATVALGVAYVFGSLMPPWEFDVVEYHLQAPKEFFQAGRINFNDHNVYANMPLGVEMHSLAAMTLIQGADGWWWGALVGKAIIGLHSLLAAALVGSLVARLYGDWSGWMAAGLLLAAPGNAHVAMAGLVDMALATYLLAALVTITLIWPGLTNRSAASPPSILFSQVLLVSLFAGAAAACKYTGLLFAVIPLFAAMVFAAVTTQLRLKRVVATAAGLLTGLAVTCLPWYLKNIVQAGNPFYPLAYNLFGGRGLTAAQAEQWQAAHRVPQVADGSSYGLHEFTDAVLQLFLRSEFLHPSLMCLMVVGLVSAWLKRPTVATGWIWAWLGVAGWILLVWWGATHRIDRFWLPVLPIWSAIGAVGATWISVRATPALAAGLVLLGMVYGGVLSCSGAVGDNRFFVSLRALRQDTGDEFMPGRLSPAIGWVNNNLNAAETKLLLIGEAKAFDFQVPIVYATCFNQNPGEMWLSGQTAEAQRNNLKRAGITHILINWSEIERYRSPGNYGFSSWPQSVDIQQLTDTGVATMLNTPWDSSTVQILQVND